jgi:hypothetical protein
MRAAAGRGRIRHAWDVAARPGSRHRVAAMMSIATVLVLAALFVAEVWWLAEG